MVVRCWQNVPTLPTDLYQSLGHSSLEFFLFLWWLLQNNLCFDTLLTGNVFEYDHLSLRNPLYMRTYGSVSNTTTIVTVKYTSVKHTQINSHSERSSPIKPRRSAPKYIPTNKPVYAAGAMSWTCPWWLNTWSTFSWDYLLVVVHGAWLSVNSNIYSSQTYTFVVKLIESYL